MKKTSQNEKKLSLKKLQMMKISNMKTVYGGTGYTRALQLEGNDDPDTVATKPKSLGGGL